MQGTVLVYEKEAEGIVVTADGARYKFGSQDWKSPRAPVPGHKVDFVPEDGRAKEIYLINPAAGAIQSTVSNIEASEKSIPTIVYAFYAAAFLYGVTMLVGVVIAYVYRGEAEGQWFKSHYDYQISIFWKSLAGFLISIPLMAFFGLGLIVMLCTYVWVIVKIVNGWRSLAEGKPIS